ncbi:hypothetical protein MKK50_15770 [Methylobacterium sp. J-043]|jgi:hypothetical protein|uniref:Uncharacterized protein n=1 Tax=Methylobacterium goesingense TaxID=243690 RepID=A0ABV2L890_9HYPH|nr:MULTISPECIES: hypothetical protein [Methylobacteriaceae]MCJ2030830.1 hypothetical protein [Methylobacterium sp. J-043]KQP04893.1 hypothetical protein ASF28_18880 [Methylobacterium sp. Leaf99]KQT49075.1 hypothetical protein ASG52_08840 [Methylobacterium sp. Leaf456]UYW33832.1 hypothetical protein OKB92_07055 [Methylorubrum extorquens]GJD74517.1 hypothetical protein CFIICLFH_2751 [Methylobacterium goesingense]
MADLSIFKPDLKGLLSLEKRELARRVLELHDELVRERARREEAEAQIRVPSWERGFVKDTGRARDADLPAVGSFHG